MALPKLKDDTARLYGVYYNHQTLAMKDLCEAFGVSRSTARKVILLGRRSANDSYISVERLFSLYGWDIDKITEKARELKGETV